MGLGVLSGIIAFLVVEKLVRIVNGGDGGGHGHSHAAPPPAKSDEMKAKDESDKEDKDEKKSDDESEKKKGEEKKEVVTSKGVEEEKGDIKVAGFLNLFADCFHNFTDGLAIGASFAAGESVGSITTLTILLHEVPHEIGDYAILIQSGVPPMKAIMLQVSIYKIKHQDLHGCLLDSLCMSFIDLDQPNLLDLKQDLIEDMR